MSESSNRSFSGFVDHIRLLNVEIDAILKSPSPLRSTDVEDLDERLEERDRCLDSLHSATEELKKTHSEEVNTFWNAFCQELSKADSERADIMSARIREAAEAIRVTQKRKALLQYQ